MKKIMIVLAIVLVVGFVGVRSYISKEPSLEVVRAAVMKDFKGAQVFYNLSIGLERGEWERVGDMKCTLEGKARKGLLDYRFIYRCEITFRALEDTFHIRYTTPIDSFILKIPRGQVKRVIGKIELRRTIEGWVCEGVYDGPHEIIDHLGRVLARFTNPPWDWEDTPEEKKSYISTKSLPSREEKATMPQHSSYFVGEWNTAVIDPKSVPILECLEQNRGMPYSEAWEMCNKRIRGSSK